MSAELETLTGLTLEQYNAEARQLGLRHSGVGVVHVCTVNGEHYDLPDAKDFTPAQRLATIKKLALMIRGY